MLRRLVPFAALGTVLVLTPAAVGAPRSCRLVTDAPDDAVGTSVDLAPETRGVYGDNDLDVVSADVATNAKYVTAVIRTATLRETSPDSPAGRMWELWFAVDGKRFRLSAAVAPDGPTAEVSYESAPGQPISMLGLGPATLKLDVARREVRITAPVSRLAPHVSLRRGTVLSGLVVHTYKHYGVSGEGQRNLPDNDAPDLGSSGFGSGTDTARSNRRYVAGGASCVRVGP